MLCHSSTHCSSSRRIVLAFILLPSSSPYPLSVLHLFCLKQFTVYLNSRDHRSSFIRHSFMHSLIFSVNFVLSSSFIRPLILFEAMNLLRLICASEGRRVRGGGCAGGREGMQAWQGQWWWWVDACSSEACVRLLQLPQTPRLPVGKAKVALHGLF